MLKALLAYYWIFYFSKVEVSMTTKKSKQILKFFQIAGIILVPIYYGIEIVKYVALLPWSEWAANGAMYSVKDFVKFVIIAPLGCVLISTFHSLTMIWFHKMWPDEYDEWGHHRK